MAAAERAAADRGVTVLHAGILARNQGAVRFYSSSASGRGGHR
ncbi:hypothetical protein [Kitasatospora paranensis]